MAEWILTDKGWRYKQEKIHLLRAQWHDYHTPSIYMLTLTSVNRDPVFGQLVGDVNTPSIALTDIGEMVAHEIQRIQKYKGFEASQLYTYVIMPDHVHILLRVHERLVRPLGYYVSWFKKQCSDRAAALAANSASNNCPALAVNSASKPPLVFATEYHDRILTHPGQLDNMWKYIADNPRRLALKRANPQLFRIHQNISSNGLDFTSLGNLFLLDYPIKDFIQCSRSMSQEQIDEKKKQCLLLADSGVIFVSAAISNGEKQIARALREAGYPLIVLLEKGFPQPNDPHYKYFKPQGVYFEACAEGRLLLLEPHKDTFERTDIIEAVLRKQPNLPHESLRYRFLALNEMVRILSNTENYPSRPQLSRSRG